MLAPKKGHSEIAILLKAITTCAPVFTCWDNSYLFTKNPQIRCALRTLSVKYFTKVRLTKQIHNMRNNRDMLSQQIIQPICQQTKN